MWCNIQKQIEKKLSSNGEKTIDGPTKFSGDLLVSNKSVESTVLLKKALVGDNIIVVENVSLFKEHDTIKIGTDIFTILKIDGNSLSLDKTLHINTEKGFKIAKTYTSVNIGSEENKFVNVHAQHYFGKTVGSAARKVHEVHANEVSADSVGSSSDPVEVLHVKNIYTNLINDNVPGTGSGSGNDITDEERSKLAGIEENADVTSSTNVQAAGAVMLSATGVNQTINSDVTIEGNITINQNSTFTGSVTGISKDTVGLANVDNTSDADKPVSTATQSELNEKLPNRLLAPMLRVLHELAKTTEQGVFLLDEFSAEDLSSAGFSEAEIFAIKNETLKGTVVNGYIQNANVTVLNPTDNSVLGTVSTDENGRFKTDVFLKTLPTLYSISVSGGTDKSTQKPNTRVFKAIASKEDTSLSEGVANVTPMTTLVHTLVTNKASVTKETLQTATSTVATAFNLNAEDIDSDYIRQENSNVSKVNNQIKVLTDSLKTVDNLSENQVIDSLATTLEQDPDSFDISSSTALEQIIETVKTENPTAVISDTLKTNVSQYVSSVNENISQTSGDFENIIEEATKLTVASDNLLNENETINLEDSDLDVNAEITKVQEETNNVTIGDIFNEPEEEFDFESLIIKTTPLQKSSSFNVDSPTGTAGIRG